jgi:Tol biopolymer transport system component
MTAVSFRHLRRLCGASLTLAAVACQGSDVTSPSTGGLQVTAATSGNPANLLTLTGHIAFVSTRAGNPEIYVMNANGTGVTRLTRNSATDGQPAWSPDGKKIAFVSNRAGNDEIYVMNADGTGVSRLTNNSASDEAPAWSPSGTKIAFQTNRDGHFEIYVMNANGGGVTRLTKNLPHVCIFGAPCPSLEKAPTWSPDGTKIAFLHKYNPISGGIFSVDIMNANGLDVTMGASALHATRVAWSPSGTKIAFDPDFNGDYEIDLMNVTSFAVTQLTNNAVTDSHPTWSPDGSKIAFQSDRAGNFEIYAMTATGTGVTRLTNNTAVDGQPTWGP